MTEDDGAAAKPEDDLAAAFAEILEALEAKDVPPHVLELARRLDEALRATRAEAAGGDPAEPQ